MPIWAINLLIGVAAAVASTLLQQTVQASRQQTQKAQESGLRNQYSTGDTQPRSFVIGTLGLAGKLEYENSWGEVNGTPRSNLVRVQSFGDIPIDGLNYLFVNGLRTTKLTSGGDDRGFPVPEYADGGTDHLFYRWKDGTQTAADDYLVSRFSSDDVYTWTSSHIGRGIPHIIVTALWNRILWGGRAPDFLAEVRGIRLYDPRKDSTAGGSGSHRADNQATWEFSDNNAVAVYNILRLGIRYNGQWVWGRKTPLSAARFPYDEWSVAMNLCDVNIALAGGGVERQFRVGREVFVNERPVDVVNKFLAACNGQCGVQAGVYHILVGEPETPTLTLSDDDFVVTETAELDPFPNFERIINGASASFLDPKQGWERKSPAAYYNTDLEASDRGQRLTEQLNLEEVFSETQVQRLLQSKVKDGRRFRKHVGYLHPKHKSVRLLQTIEWNSVRNAYSGKEFQIMSRAVRADGMVLVSMREVDPSDHTWDPETDEQEIIFVPSIPQLPAPQLMVGWSAVASAREDDNGNQWGPSVIVTFPGQQTDVRAVAIEIREGWLREGESEKFVVFNGESPYDPNVLVPAVEAPVNLERRRVYEVRGRFLPFSGRVTRWTNQNEDGDEGPWFSILTLNIPTVAPGGVDLVALNQELKNITGPLVEDIYNRFASFDEALGDLANVVADNSNFSKKSISGLSARNSSVAAAVLRVEQVILGPGSAFASLVEEVTAVKDNLFADGLLKITAEVDEMTQTTRILLKAVANNGTVADTAALQLMASVTGPTESESSVRVLADRFDFISETDDYVTSAFQVNATFVQVTTLRIKDLVSIDGTTIVMNGVTGQVSFSSPP